MKEKYPNHSKNKLIENITNMLINKKYAELEHIAYYIRETFKKEL